ncbi:MAG: ArsR family transcriptional regulator [Anaerolineae bacterium]|jgi:predicted ArsR family transcriptional regulator
MQATRERILNILKERGHATVKELSQTLDLTTVTIRHHLDTLRRENFVAAPTVRHRKAPGRPQHVYALTQEASGFFPKRYERLIDLVFAEVHSRLSQDEVASMMERIGKRMAREVTMPDNADIEQRVAITADFLEERGYMPYWERNEVGDYLLHVANCPYEGVIQRHSEVCRIDRTLLAELMGSSLAHLSRTVGPPRHCTYLIQRARD